MTAVRFQALPPLSPDEYQSLEQSIVENGVLVAIITDENGVVIDGHHRQKIAAVHGLHCPKRVMRNLDDPAKRTLALSLNLDRRHLTREQRRALVAESIKADPQLADTLHAKRTGVSDKTATAVRSELESTSEIPKLDKTVGSDGRARPAAQPVPRCPACGGPEGWRDGVRRCWPCADAGESDAIAQKLVAADKASPPEGDCKESSLRRNPKEPRRRPITDAFDSARYDLRKVIERVVRLTEDDRFKKNKDQITGDNLSDLIRARDALTGVIQQLEG